MITETRRFLYCKILLFLCCVESSKRRNTKNGMLMCALELPFWAIHDVEFPLFAEGNGVSLTPSDIQMYEFDAQSGYRTWTVKDDADRQNGERFGPLRRPGRTRDADNRQLLNMTSTFIFKLGLESGNF